MMRDLRINQTREHEHPRLVSSQINVEIVPQAIKELLFHLVDLSERNAGDVGPCFVGVCVTTRE